MSFTKNSRLKGQANRIRELGGLCIIGTERHESRRIDNQLRGRSGRQGDPGQTQFFISLEDELMRLFGGERIQGIVEKLGVSENEAIEASMLTKSVENAQKRVEGRNFSIRKYVLQYDNVMNKQREIIYDERRRVLFGEDLRHYIMNMVQGLIDEIIDPVVIASRFPEEWDLDTVWNGLSKLCQRYGAPSYTKEEIESLTVESLKERAYADFETLYEEKEKEIGADRMRELERMILLRVVDNHWMDHIDDMDQLKNGIGLRALGQQDPAAAYASEGFDMFELMIGDIKEQTVRFCYNVTVQTNTERKQVISGGREQKEDFDGGMQGKTQAAGGMDGSAAAYSVSSGSMPAKPAAAPRESKPETYKRKEAKVGRNDPCPCGSGKKYKNCCGREQ